VINDLTKRRVHYNDEKELTWVKRNSRRSLYRGGMTVQTRGRKKSDTHGERETAKGRPNPNLLTESRVLVKKLEELQIPERE